MKLFKKFIVAFVLIFVLTFSFTACKKSNTPPATSNPGIENGDSGEEGGGETDGNKGDGEESGGEQGGDEDDDEQGGGDHGDGEQSGDENDDNKGDDNQGGDNQGDGDHENENPKDETKSLSLEEFLSDVLAKDFDLSHYSFEIEEIVKGVSHSYFGNVTAKSSADGNNEVTSFYVNMQSDGEIVSYLSERVIKQPNNVKNVSGIVIDEKERYYSYIEELSYAESADYVTWQQYLLMQRAMFMFDNEYLFDGSFLKTYKTAFGFYVSDEVITAEIKGDSYVYKFSCKNLSGKDFKMELTFNGSDLTTIYYYDETDDGSYSVTLNKTEAQEDVVVPNHADGTYIQEKSTKEE